MKTYTTGTFAKIANVTERTIRYYDKIGLLKPSFIMENGYRQYTDDDLIKLQRIISLKSLGFSLEEIYPLALKNDRQSLVDSLDLQIELVNKKIISLQKLKDTLLMTKNSSLQGDLHWNKIVDLLQLSNYENELLEQYRNSNNLNVRVALHEKYSVNKVNWFDWIYSNIDFTVANKILEVGCGDGKLWKNRRMNTRNREIFLSDSSKGMIEDAKKNLNDNFSFMVFNCEAIPFKKGYFDIVIANHLLFYLNDIEEGLNEIHRVLANHGVFYCSTYGKNHMKEITELVQEFDPKIVLSRSSLYDKFGIENGKEKLETIFEDVSFVEYEDHLEIDEAAPLIDYILSCHGNQNEILMTKLNEFKQFVENKVNQQGKLYITKQAGLFICKK